MALEALEGRTYGPFVFELSRAKVAEYVAATSDDPDRWANSAPPSYAGAVLFKAAPAFLFDPDVGPHAKLLIHGEQVFRWPQPWKIGSILRAVGSVDRIRERGGVTFSTFTMNVHDDDERHVLESKSVFLMSADTPPGGGEPERQEPAPEDRAANDGADPIELPGPGERLPAVPKSASRSDLVRYAAASEDYNPMHWDHTRAHDAGVGGVICHGLLMAAWATQAVTRVDGARLEEARFRFRSPLFPAAAAKVTGAVSAVDDHLASLKVAVESEAGEHVAATLRARMGSE